MPMPPCIWKLFSFCLLRVENYTRWRIPMFKIRTTLQMSVSFALLAVDLIWIFTKRLNYLHFRFSTLRWYSWSKMARTCRYRALDINSLFFLICPWRDWRCAPIRASVDCGYSGLEDRVSGLDAVFLL